MLTFKFSATAAEKPVLLDRATLSLMNADLKAADAKCPAKAVPGAMVQTESCILKAERLVWMKYSPRTLDLFDTFASQLIAAAQMFDNRSYTSVDYATAMKNVRIQFSLSLRKRVVEEFRSALKSAEAACPSRAIRGQMVQTETCRLVEHQRIIWARYQPQTLDLFDNYSAQQLELAQKFDKGGYSADDYIIASKTLTSNFAVSLKTRLAVAQAAQQSVPTTSTQPSPAPSVVTAPALNTPLSDAAIAPSDACLFASSLIGLVAGLGSRRADTGINSAAAFLKGCTEGIGH